MEKRGEHNARRKLSKDARERISNALKGNKNRAGKTIPPQSRTRRVSVCLPANIFRKCKRLSVEMEIPFSHALSACLAAFLKCDVPARMKKKHAPGNPSPALPGAR